MESLNKIGVAYGRKMYPLLLSHHRNASNITCDSNETVYWILNVFHECVDTPKEEVGFILGLISICCWVCASVPQLIENYRKKHVEEAISFFFLVFWLLGDSSNLIGCFLTKQLSIQIITAVYYVCMDIVMILQYLYYKQKNRRRAAREMYGFVNDVLENGNNYKNSKHIVACFCMMVFLPLSLVKSSFYFQSSLTSSDQVRIGRTLLSTGDIGHPLFPTNPEEIIGYTIGFISSIFYLASRLPQLYKNYKRHGTEGVSIHLFVLAVIGNALYGSSILLMDPDPGQTYAQFIILHLPWLVGSLGTMSLDFSLIMQILYYNPPCQKSQDVDDVDPLLA